MPTPILATKLFVPPPRPKAIFRPRLIERMNEGARGKLTLISAPAGFGKSTLVGEWLATSERRTAWLSLDEGDSDLARFLAYFIAALQTIAANLGEGALAALRASQPPPTEVILTALLNELAGLPDESVLVLDDYHVVDAAVVDQALAFLLEHLPPHLHLVISTREDPSLPLARLRARGQLTELRAVDLRFSSAEAAEFLNQAMGLNLAPQEVAALETRTEGWVTGLQLAGLSMRGRADASGFIKAFAGNHRYIIDYLVEEVLQRQPDDIREFLLQTSMLERLCGSLCDAVTGQMAGQARLEALERGNFFIMPLDDSRHWYRYHHLFADILSAYLREEQPGHVPTLHRRACEWYEQNGLRGHAIQHALAAEDYTRAATLIELAVPEMRRSRQETTLLSWLKALPDETLRDRPMLNVHFAGALLQGGELENVEAHLRDVEQWLETRAKTGAEPTALPEDVRGLPGWIANYRAGYALVQGDMADTVAFAGRARRLLPEDDYLGHGAATALLGLAYWRSGNLDAAHRTYAEGMAKVQSAGFMADAIGGVFALADIRIAQGRLRDAMRTYERGLALASTLASEQGAPVVRGTADLYVGMSELYLERNELSAAMQCLSKSKEQGESTGFAQYPYRWRVAMAKIREAEGELDEALVLLDEAERLYVSDFYPNVRPVGALRARVWTAQGRLDDALDWAQARALAAGNELSYLHEFEHITLARILLTGQRRNPEGRFVLDAIELLERLLEAAEEGGRTGSAIEILVVQALAHQLRGDIAAARGPLQRALILAEPENYVRTFVSEGPRMAQLLLEVIASREFPAVMTAYPARLLAALGVGQAGGAGDSLLLAALLPAAAAAQPLVEPLSPRELEVLRLFQSELSGPEIAQELVVALSTVRTHTKRIYEKLNVKSRRAAVKRATELGLI